MSGISDFGELVQSGFGVYRKAISTSTVASVTASPTTAENMGDENTLAWEGSLSAIAPDGESAVSLPSSLTDTDRLLLGGFDFSDIPETATITGVTVNATLTASGGDVTARVWLASNDEVISGLLTADWPIESEEITITGTPTQWQVALPLAVIQTGFCVAIAAIGDLHATVVGIDAVEVVVSYTTGNDFGETVETWPATPHATVQGVLRHLSGSKRFVASVHGYNADHRLYLDAPLDILAGDQVKIGSDTYEVRFVNDVMDAGEMLQVDMESV